VQDPIRAKLARARTKLDAVQQWGADPARSDRQRETARRLARSCNALISQREQAVDYEEAERQKLLKGADSRCMFLTATEF
jgi:hypothetical protein